MRLTIDGSLCQGHARCALASEALFAIDEDGFGSVLQPDPPPEALAAVERAIGDCPEKAVRYE